MNARLAVSFALYALWIAVTLLGATVLSDGKQAPLDEMVKNGIAWQFLAAIVLLIIFIIGNRWTDLGFNAPHALFRTLWFPIFWLLLITTLLLVTGLPPAHMIGFIVLNTLMVGVSEEVMFRGVLFRALLSNYRIWTAIIVSSLLFGAVHILNVFATGNLSGAVLQSIPAAMSGVLFVAIVIRTGSIWPAIGYHAVWDCALFLLVTSNANSGAEANPSALESLGIGTLLLPIAMGVPNFLCGLILLRKVRNDTAAEPNASGPSAG
ncbi:CPBP family intramembrane glutamic endopeptidase [Pelagibacterium sediminicola]|uniref:CPBP family intramembrane glutamic endopeptidase n=1 Tax=Pelagibacterium sediminicola TaxID=2248761 RepID=UPI000E32374B|nr:type II CAAX endopeptidase family protein [Pelagibacterium sediminicola]